MKFIWKENPKISWNQIFVEIKVNLKLKDKINGININVLRIRGKILDDSNSLGLPSAKWKMPKIIKYF